MKRKSLFKTVVAAAAIALFGSCSSDDNHDNAPLVLEKEQITISGTTESEIIRAADKADIYPWKVEVYRGEEMVSVSNTTNREPRLTDAGKEIGQVTYSGRGEIEKIFIDGLLTVLRATDKEGKKEAAFVVVPDKACEQSPYDIKIMFKRYKGNYSPATVSIVH